jgi:LPXTG-motif cell wall-anchored protein
MRGMTVARIVLAASAALIAAFGITGPAYADDTVGLNDGQKNKPASSFTDSCENVPGGEKVGFDGWVFVLPKSGGPNGSEFVTLKLTFEDQNGATHTVVINSTGATIDGKAADGGLITKANAEDTSKAWVRLPAGWIIVDGTALVTDGTHESFFNVTHVCQGGETTPSPTPSESSSSSGTPSESGSSGGGSSGSSSSAGGGGGSLPTTGAKIGVLVGIGLVLVAGGVGLVALRRRRDIVVTPDGS